MAAATMDVDSSTSTPLASPNASTNDLKKLNSPPSSPPRRMSLQERGRIPVSFYLTVTVLLGLEGWGGLWKLDTLSSWWTSMKTSGETTRDYLAYLRDLMQSAASGDLQDWYQVAKATIVFAFSLSLLYVFFWAPFRAGLWTGHKAKRHKIHRYMGLAYLLQYSFAWIELLTNYENGGKLSYLPHFIAVNGLIQGYSAYFSFKVLPELEDAGYYSDKAVLSRSFVHENIFFTVMGLFGSIYYHNDARASLQSHLGGRILEHLFVFWPYIAVRTAFPITRFKNAGTGRGGRTSKNEQFYTIGTNMIKIFYLWAKYFLGFCINFMVYLDLIKPENQQFVQGLYLLNLGTVSLAIFLHTLRFKKVLPPKFTFSVYIAQIYASFTALPYAYDTFSSHPKLCWVSLAGLLCNMTRNRKIHAVWCFCTMILMTQCDIDW